MRKLIIGLFALVPTLAYAQAVSYGSAPGVSAKFTAATVAGSIASGTTAISSGSDTSLCFDDGGVINCADTGLTYVKATAALTVGVAATATGKVGIAGTTSGVVTITAGDAAGTYNFNLPASAGTSGQYLISGGGGSTVQSYTSVGSFTTVAASSTITSTRTTDIGWSVVAGADTACNTTCTNACVVGFDSGASNLPVACTDAAADVCLCAGSS